MSESPVGKSIGPYQLVEEIDASGNALVYKGFQPSANRYVAVKVLKPHTARDAAAVQQFKQRGELAAGMQHPNILPVYDMGQEEGVVYQVSRYVEGGSLRDHMVAYRDVRQAQELFYGIAAGLEYIHSQGNRHGNLKPTNILMHEAQRPLLADFGYAMQHSAAVTPYLSPEQTGGGAIDRRSDVYALGVILYEMLVGVTPAPGAPISLRASRPDLPESLEQVVLKALADNPDYRFQTVAEFQNALVAALRPVAPAPQPVPTAAPAPTPVAVPQPEPRGGGGTNCLAVILGALLVVLLIGGAVLVIREISGEPATEVPPAVEAPVEPQPPAQEVVVPPPPAQEQPPAAEAPPVEAPPVEEAPPAEAPPAEPPAEGDAPPADDGGSSGLPVCGSIGFAGGMMVLGGAMASRKRHPGSKRF